MPGIDGFEVFKRIQALDKDLPVVAITAVVSPTEREKALQAGFYDYFNKPIVEIQRLREPVYSHVGKCANPPYDPEKPAA